MRIASFLAPSLRSLYESVTAAVGQALGVRATLVTGEDYGDLLRGHLDAAFICGLPYVTLRERAADAVEPLAAPIVAGARYGGRPVYFSDVVVRANDPAEAFADLRGRRWAYNEPQSHSGSNVVLAHLARSGLDGSFFSAMTRVGSHSEALRRVLLGEADAAAIDSHLLEVIGGADAHVRSRIRTVTSLGPSPIQPLVAGAALPGPDRERVRAVVAELGVGPSGTLVERWVPVTDEDYEPIRAMRDEAASLAVT
jgi:phosphonate transport system substrate-binding protein